jgi:hypothetical protein
MTDLPKPRLPDRLRLPVNCVDVTECAVGTITAVVGHVGPKGAPKGELPETALEDRP